MNELEVLAVERGKSKSSCEAYVKNQGIEYSFLTADKETIAKLINDYQAGSGVPQFYLIGKDRTIIAKFQGYAEKTTDTEIEKEDKSEFVDQKNVFSPILAFSVDFSIHLQPYI